MRLGKRVLLLSMAAVLAIGAAGCGGKKDVMQMLSHWHLSMTLTSYR